MIGIVLLVFCGFVSSAAVSCNVFLAIFLCDEEGPARIPVLVPESTTGLEDK